MHDILELMKHKMKKKMRRMISIIKPLIITTKCTKKLIDNCL